MTELFRKNSDFSGIGKTRISLKKKLFDKGDND
jgi:hypothetical protein